jgi:hypothetical protein
MSLSGHGHPKACTIGIIVTIACLIFTARGFRETTIVIRLPQRKTHAKFRGTHKPRLLRKTLEQSIFTGFV